MNRFYLIKLNHRIRVLLLCAGLPFSAQAIDLQPEDVIAPKPGISAVQAGYIYSQRGDQYYRNTKVRDNTEIETSQAYLRLARTFNWSGRPSVAYLQVPYGSVNARVTGALDRPSHTGDLVLLLASWPYVDIERHRFFAWAGYLSLPTGDYDSRYTAGAINTNLGENRYRLAFQLGYHQRLAKNIGWQAAFDTTWFGSNDDFRPNGTQLRLTRKPLFAAQTSLAYRARPDLGLGISYFYTYGGENSYEGVTPKNESAIHRYQLSATYEMQPFRFALQYGGDLKTQTGFKEDRLVALRLTRFF